MRSQPEPSPVTRPAPLRRDPELEAIVQTQRAVMGKLEEVLGKLESQGNELENVKISLKDIKARI